MVRNSSAEPASAPASKQSRSILQSASGTHRLLDQIVLFRQDFAVERTIKRKRNEKDSSTTRFLVCAHLRRPPTIYVELGCRLNRSRLMMIKSGAWLAVAGIAFGFCCLGAGWMALRLIRSNRAALIATLPLRAEQTIAVESPGELIVSVEVPRLSTDYRRWEFEVVEENSGRIHAMKYGGPRSTGAVTGITTIKIPLGRLTLARPDKLTLRVKGLASDVNYSTYHLVLARPHLMRMALQITGLVLCGVGTLLSLLWGLWLLGVVKAS